MELKRAGAVLALALLVTASGCTQLLLQEETSFVASKANVSDAGTVGFGHNESEWQNVTRTVEAAGQEREVTVSNRAEVFLNRSRDGTPAASFVVVSTPQVEAGGQELNPVAEWSQRDLLRTFSDEFDEHGNLSAVEERETREVTMLGTETDMRVFNATMVRDDETADDVVVSVARVKHGADYVVAIDVRGLNEADIGATGGTAESIVGRVEH